MKNMNHMTTGSRNDFEWDLSALEEDKQNREPLTLEETIVVDTREKKPYNFRNYDVGTTKQGLETGDYSLDGYESQFAIERKEKKDFLKSITHSRKQFKEELVRASSFEIPMPIVVEAPWKDYENGQYMREVHPNAVIGTVKAWEKCYNIEWHFEKDRSTAERKTFELLTEISAIV